MREEGRKRGKEGGRKKKNMGNGKEGREGGRLRR